MATEIDNGWTVERVEGLLADVTPRIEELFPNADYDPDNPDPIVCQHCNGALDDHRANCVVVNVRPLLEVIRWLLSERSTARDEAISDAILALGAIRNRLSTDDALLVYTAIDKLREQK